MKELCQIYQIFIKYKHLYLIEEDEYLLLNNNIKVRSNKNEKFKEIIKNKKNICGEFIIPGKFISYTNDSRLKIKISNNFKNLLKQGDIYIIQSDLCRIVSQKGYNYFISN